MELLSVQQRGKVLSGVRSLLKVELRDHYAMDDALFASWRAGDLGAVRRAAEAYRDTFEARRYERFGRVKVVSEPLSEYHRFVLDFSALAIELTGADIRWLPRRLTSGLLLPGNDFFVLDGEKALFNVLDGDDNLAEVQLYREPEVVKACLEAFAAASALAVPLHEYAAG
ncbi:DUF6879 family protein [Actinomadura rupiterrae]|uniref:DUF6879 family protein n=1 Tax=Actinomadura rupiterrae TaxID=559627 RepID=UPI0020A4AF2E|nr:DUF6879 family protein [Actinomadura rupiterrae]MCP2343060.1 hypothetical protein [Actinomadura rupiterrae]